jgi:hypothetical protein
LPYREIEDTSPAVAFRLAYLSLRPKEWITRRVEQVRYLDQRTTERRISIDFEIPGLRSGCRRPVPWVPIAQLQKATLVNFDLQDEDGRSLPMLATEQNGILSAAMLLAIARAERPDAVDRVVENYVPFLVFAKSENERRLARQRLFPDTSIGRELHEATGFTALARELAENFVVYIDTSTARVGDRRIVKLAYEKSDLAPKPVGIRRGLGWKPSDDGFAVPSVGYADSFHLEVEAPTEMRFLAGELAVRGGAPVRPALAGRRAHFHVRNAGRGTGVVGTTLVAESPLLGAAFFASSLNAAAITFVRFRLYEDGFLAGESREALVAALLAVPGLVVAYMARPSEHQVLTGFLKWIRTLAFASAFLSFVAALTLFAGYEGDQLRRIYFVLAGLSIFVSLALCRSCFPQWRRE